MQDLHKEVGCSLWLGTFLVALFAAEWVILQRLFTILQGEAQILATLVVILLTILGGWIAIYRRLQPHPPPNQDARRTPHRRNGERGDSLLELLIAIAIISLALVVFITSLSTGALGVGYNARRTRALTLATSQLEAVKAAAYDAGGAYATIAAPDGYTILLDTAVISTGLQQVTATVLYNGDVLVSISNYKVNR
ncbi:MAG: type IV pilus modification PilV family protein [Anaerolineae bacterium]